MDALKVLLWFIIWLYILDIDLLLGLLSKFQLTKFKSEIMKPFPENICYVKNKFHVVETEIINFFQKIYAIE